MASETGLAITRPSPFRLDVQINRAEGSKSLDTPSVAALRNRNVGLEEALANGLAANVVEEADRASFADGSRYAGGMPATGAGTE